MGEEKGTNGISCFQVSTQVLIPGSSLGEEFSFSFICKRQAPCNFNRKLLKWLGTVNLIDCVIYFPYSISLGRCTHLPGRALTAEHSALQRVILPHQNLQMVSLHSHIQLWFCSTRFVTVFGHSAAQVGQCRWQLQFRNGCRRSGAVTARAAVLPPLPDYSLSKFNVCVTVIK